VIKLSKDEWHLGGVVTRAQNTAIVEVSRTHLHNVCQQISAQILPSIFMISQTLQVYS